MPPCISASRSDFGGAAPGSAGRSAGGGGSAARPAPAGPRGPRGQERGAGRPGPAAAHSAGPAAAGMLRYSSGLTVTATTPRRPPGDSGRSRRKVRGAGGGGEVPGGIAGRGAGLTSPLVRVPAERLPLSPTPFLISVFLGKACGVCEIIFLCVLCSRGERKSFWGVLQGFCSSSPWPVL